MFSRATMSAAMLLRPVQRRSVSTASAFVRLSNVTPSPIHSTTFATSSPSQALRKRMMSTTTSSSSSSSSSAGSTIASAFSWLRRNLTVTNVRTYWPQFAAAGGGLVVLWGVSSAAVHIATVLLELDMKQVFYIGFLTGVATSASFVIGGWRAYRAITIAPDAVYRAALHKLQRNAVVRAELGNSIRAGHLKAYEVNQGHFSIDKRFGWVEPRVQMLFQVVGDKAEGMVTCEAVKHRGSLAFSVIALDTLAQQGKPSVLILVAGKEEKLHVRGTLRGFLQTERAQYVEQDVTMRDEDRLTEQEEVVVEPEAGSGTAAPAAAAPAPAPAPAATATGGTTSGGTGSGSA